MRLFNYFCIFSSKILSRFDVLLYKALLEFLQVSTTRETFFPCLIVFDNLCKVFGCSIVMDFVWIIWMFYSDGFCVDNVCTFYRFWLLSNYLRLFYQLCVFLS